MIVGPYDIPVSIFKKVLFTAPGGVWCRNKWCQKFSLGKLLQISMILGPYDIPASIFKKVLFTPPGGVGCQNKSCQKFSLENLLQISTILGPMIFQCRYSKKCSLRHRVVSDVKTQIAKIFFFKGHPFKYKIMLRLWLVLSKPPITGVFRGLPVNWSRSKIEKNFQRLKFAWLPDTKNRFPISLTVWSTGGWSL